MTVEIISQSISMKVWGWDEIKLVTLGFAIGLATDYPTGPSTVYNCGIFWSYSLAFVPYARHQLKLKSSIEPWHWISNNVVCATSKASDQPAHTRSLISVLASRLSIL